MIWDEAALVDWYQLPVGRRMVGRLLRQLRRWPVLRWQGREAPSVLALGVGGMLNDLWPGRWAQAEGRSEGSYDRIVLLHALEHEQNPQELLDACWREVCPGGLVLVIVPNRWSVGRWAREWGPFGEGRSYGARKLFRQVNNSGFTVLHQQTVLPLWPTGRGLSLPFVPGLLRIIVLRKDVPAMTRLKLKPLMNTPAVPAGGGVAYRRR